MPKEHWQKETDGALAFALAVAGCALYVRTLAPSVVALFDDSLEFQLVCYQLGIAHPTGYPLYTLLGKLFTFLPVGDAAYRVNLLSALAGGCTWPLLFVVGRALGLRRTGALASAVALGTSPVFWSQATVAEVYALHSLFVALLLLLALRWGQARDPWTARGRLWGLAFAWGLSLTHHRMTLLLLPALALYAGWVILGRQMSARHLVLGSRRGPGFWGQTAGALACFALPLALYAYLPLRGRVVTSLDGQYVNTWAGFWAWVSARAYSVFLGENPLARDLDAAFTFDLFREQFGFLGLGLAGLGACALLRRPREWTLLVVAFAVQVAFALLYRVGDVEVFFLPAFLVAALFVGAGVSLWGDLGQALAERGLGRPVALLGRALGVLALAGMVYGGATRFPAADRSQDWGVYDYGIDVLTQPLEEGATLIGILGETTLVRYYQEALGLRADLRLVAADDEHTRLAALREAVARGEAVYRTRELPCRDPATLCAPREVQMTALGPLVRVWPKGGAVVPAPQVALDVAVGTEVALDGYGLFLRQTHGGPVLRITLHWAARTRPQRDYKVSARLLNPAGETEVAVDDVPVHRAYPTPFWGAGERVVDVYDLPAPAGVGAGWQVLVILYEADTLQEAGRVTIPLPETLAP
ncbi:MAG: glycosyltransferase family 117 protein [Anaerolineae bacterium]